MKYTTIDGQQFDCELEALRHENNILMNKARIYKEQLNKQYGHVQQGGIYHTLLEKMFEGHNVDIIAMDTDSVFFNNGAAPVDFSRIPTGVLVDELVKKEGVVEVMLDPDEAINMVGEDNFNHEITGPARILVVVD